MARASVSQRLRSFLRQRLKHGHGVAIERFSAQRPGGAKIKQQELSYFLHPQPGVTGRRGLTMDDLDDLSAFFRVSIGEMIGDTETGSLTGDEQRMVYAFRALPPSTQEHFLSLIEAASLAPRSLSVQSRAASQNQTLPSSTDGSITDGHGEPGPIRETTTSGSLVDLHRTLTRLSLELADAATHPMLNRSVSGAAVEKSSVR